ncbi:MAG: outer membrane protein assembly factor BamA, partial [Thermodesulfobacteriota bacterium]
MLTSLLKLKKIKLSIFIIILALIINLFFIHSSGFSQSKKKNPENQTISKIEIIGNKRIETELIELNVKTRSGDKYSLEKVRDDLKRIYKLGYFENVYVETEEKDGELEVFYVVDEKPVIVDLRISGNDKVKDDKIEESMEIKEGEIIDLKKVDSSLDSIRNLYSQKGFVGTNVDYEIEPEGDGTVTLTYNIKEGKTAYIKEVNFVGNENIKAKVIKERIYSRPKGFLSFITKKGLYNIEEIERDKERIRAVYLDHGYLDVNVSSPEITYLEKKKGYDITFNIQEGPQYTVEAVSFEGDFVESPEKLEEVVTLKPGDIFSSAKISADIASLTTFFGDQGFAFANIAPKFSLNRQELLVQISYQIERGNEVYVRYIDIVGNLHTRDQVIRREIEQQEQSLYNATEVDSIRASVSRLGFFDNNVEIDQNRVAGSDDLLDILVKVDERPTGFFSVAGGFSSVETFIFAGQVQESNLFGYGKRLSLNAQIGGVTQTVSLTYTDPNFRGSDYLFDIIAFYNEREFRDFNRRAWGGTFGFGKLLWRYLSARIAYRLEN